MLIHYIWAENLDSEINQRCCQLGPISLATRSADAEIIMWVSDAATAIAHDLFKTYVNISVKSIEATLKSSMKRGDCYDNAAMESWNHSFKVEAVHGEPFLTRADA